MQLPPDAAMALLIRDAQGHDAQAFDRLYDMFADLVYRYCYYHTGDGAAAGTLVGDVFVRSVKQIRDMRLNTPGLSRAYAGWLLGIAQAQLAEYDRQQRENGSGDVAGEDQLDHAPLRRALRQLPPDQQQVLLLRFVERLGVEDVAGISGQSITTIKGQQYRALQALGSATGRLQNLPKAGRM